MTTSEWERKSLAIRREILDRTVFVWAVLALCGLLPIVLVLGIGDRPPVPFNAAVLQYAILLWAGLRLAGIAGAGKARPTTTIFWLYVYVWLGLAGFTQLLSGHSPPSWPMPLPAETVVRTQLVILAGLVAVELGALTRSAPRRRFLPRRTISGRAVVWLGIYALVTFPFWLHQLGGASALLTSRENLSAAVYGDGKAQAGLIVAFSTVPTFMAAYTLWLSRRYRLVARGLSGLLLCAVVAINVLINSPIAMPRFWTGTIVVAVIFGTAWVRKHGRIRIVIAGALIATIVLFPYGAYFRYNSGFKPVSGVTATLETKSDYDSYQMIGAAVQRAERRGHTMGRQTTGALLFFVPRSQWPSKPLDTGAELTGEAGLVYTNVSAPLWAEAYLDFGFLGVILIFALYGRFMRRLDDLFLNATTPFALIAAPVIAGYSVIILRGSLLQAMVRLFAIALCLWIVSRKSVSGIPVPVDKHPAGEPDQTTTLRLATATLPIVTKSRRVTSASTIRESGAR